MEKLWTLKKNNSGKWFLTFTALLELENCPSADEILLEAKRKGIKSSSLVSKKTIEDYLKKHTGSGIEPVSLPLELDPNFDARITTNNDKTAAYLYVRKDADSVNEVDMSTINRLLQRSNIANIDTEKVKEGLSDFINSSEMEFSMQIAEGSPPKRGPDKKLITHFEQIPDHEVQRLADRLKRPDLRTPDVENPTTDKDYPLSEAETLTVVEKGDLIYEVEDAGLGEAGVDVYGQSIPGLPGNDPFFLDLRNIVQNHSELRAGETGLLLIANTERGLKIRIVPYRDAKVRAVISRDKMEVSLILQSGLGAGERLSVIGVKTALNEVNLLDSISDAKINEIIESARKLNDECEFVILSGTPPIAPGSYRLEWSIKFNEELSTATVEKDALILTARLLPKGEKGKNVFGEFIDPKNAEPTDLPANDETIKVTEEKHVIKFFAAESGELSFFNNALVISSLKTIQSDIDTKFGDISFPGNLIITGDIKDDVKVKSKGKLTITGTVEKALIYSEDSLTLNGGINGKGRGTVWAKDKTDLQYAENARVFSGGDISIASYCFKCLVKTNGTVHLTGNPGVLLGGSIHAAKGVSVHDLGAEKTIRTIISFGQDYLIKDEIEVREKEIEDNNAELAKIEKDLQANPPDVDALRQKKVKLLKRNSALTVRIFNLKENFEFHIPSKIKVTGSVYPGVVLESHGRYFEVMETHHNVFFEFDEKNGQIICSPIKEVEVELE